MHTYDAYVLSYPNGNSVQYTNRDRALRDFFSSKEEGAVLKDVVKTAPCYKPTRGYCGLCYPYAINAGTPDYTESDEHIPAHRLEVNER